MNVLRHNHIANEQKFELFSDLIEKYQKRVASRR